MALNDVVIKIRGDSKNAEDSIKRVQSSFGKMNDSLKKMRGPMLAIGAALTGAGILSVKAASDLEESMNAVNVIFEDAADIVHKFGEESATAVGLTTAEFNQLSATTAALLKDTGRPLTEVADITNDLAVRAADMASVFNTDVSDAMSAIQQALRGETEAIRRYAGDVTDATLEQFALAEGIEGTVKEMDQQEKRLLRVALIMQQTEKFAGDFANTSDSLANSIRITRSQFTNAAAELGVQLLPAMSKIVGALSDAITAFSNLSQPVKNAILIAGGATLAMVALGLVIPPLIAGVSGLSAAFGTLLFTVSPWIALIAAAIAAQYTWMTVLIAAKNAVDNLINGTEKTTNPLKIMGEHFEGLKTKVKELTGTFTDFVTEQDDNTESLVTNIDEQIISREEWANSVKKNIKEVSAVSTEHTEKIQKDSEKQIEAIREMISGILPKMVVETRTAFMQYEEILFNAMDNQGTYFGATGAGFMEMEQQIADSLGAIAQEHVALSRVQIQASLDQEDAMDRLMKETRDTMVERMKLLEAFGSARDRDMVIRVRDAAILKQLSQNAAQLNQMNADMFITTSALMGDATDEFAEKVVEANEVAKESFNDLGKSLAEIAAEMQKVTDAHKAYAAGLPSTIHVPGTPIMDVQSEADRASAIMSLASGDIMVGGEKVDRGQFMSQFFGIGEAGAKTPQELSGMVTRPNTIINIATLISNNPEEVLAGIDQTQKDRGMQDLIFEGS